MMRGASKQAECHPKLKRQHGLANVCAPPQISHAHPLPCRLKGSFGSGAGRTQQSGGLAELTVTYAGGAAEGTRALVMGRQAPATNRAFVRTVDEPVQQTNGPAALSTAQVDLWRQRLEHEQWSSFRAHPANVFGGKLGRDARLRTEITLALRADSRLMRAPAPPPPRRQPFTARPLPTFDPVPMLRASTVASDLAATGSFTTSALRATGARFKNEESGSWG